MPGRAIVIGVAVKIVVALLRAAIGGLSGFFDVVDTVAGLAIAAGAIYFIFRLLVLAKRRLLWRVRRKLILSYIFIGLVPALLIVAFFLLCGLLLFYNFSSYLVQTRLRALAERTQSVAQSTAFEIERSGGRDVASLLERRQELANSDASGVSIAVVPVARACDATPHSAASQVAASRVQTAGPWSHVDPPTAVPEWIGCGGFAGLFAYSHPTGLGPAAAAQGPSVVINGRRVQASDGSEDTHMLVRAVAFPESTRPGYAVVVDTPVNESAREELRRTTGVELRNVMQIEDKRGGVNPLPGKAGGHAASPAARSSAESPFSWVTFVEYHDWTSGQTGSLFVSTQLSISEIYDRISATQGLIGNRSFSQAILLVLLVVVGGLFLIIEVIALIVGLALAKSITGSVHALFTGTERVRQGDFTHKIGVRARDQLGELAESFNQMTASIEDLLRQAAEKKRLEEELRIAREIQMSLLPQGPLLMPGLSVTALCVPAREVGGDYYDFLPLDDHRLGVLIADVSGKGTSAALYMAELKGLVLSLSQIHRSPRELLISANRIIADNLDARSFITMTYGVIDLRARTLTYARAGHTPLIYLPGSGESRGVKILAPDGMVLGLKLDKGEMFERLLQESIIPLHAGDVCLLFTDGITEAMNDRDDCFGEGRLGQLIEEHAHLPPDELRERVLREIEAFVGTAPQHDDMTMILIKIDDLGDAAALPTIDAEHAQLTE